MSEPSRAATILAPAEHRRVILVWVFSALALAAAIYAGAAGIKVNFRFDLACDLRDFPNYFFAVKAHQQGISPYDMHAIAERFQPFLLWAYPSALLHLFAPLTVFDLAMAGAIFTMIKVVVLGLMVLAWRNAFALLRNDLLFAVFICIGLNLTLYHDVCGGNVSVFEAAAIAWALLFLLRQKLHWFFVLIALAGMWKIVPLGLALLAPLVYPRRKAAWLGTALLAAIALALLGGWYLAAPGEVEKWLALGRFTAHVRVSYFEGIKEVYWPHINAANLARWYERPEIFGYAAIFLLIAAVSFAAWRRSLAVDSDAVRLWRLLLGATAFVSLMPGAFHYTYVFALPLIYLPLRLGLRLSPPWAWLALIGFAFALIPSVPWYRLAGAGLVIYQPLFAATAAWLLCLGLRREFSRPFEIPAQSGIMVDGGRQSGPA